MTKHEAEHVTDGPLRVAVFGAGRWGSRIIATIESMTGPDLEIAAIVRSQNDWRSVLDGSVLDGSARDGRPPGAVIVATPPELHVEMALAALRSDIPVMVEKPVAMSTDALDELIEVAVEHSEVPLLVDYTYFFHLGYEAFRSQVSAMNPPFEITSEGWNHGPFRSEISPLWDYGPHDVAMALDIFGLAGTNPETGTDPETEPRLTRAAFRPGKDGGRIYEIQIDGHEAGSAQLQFGNGGGERRRWISVTSESGTAEFEDLAPSSSGPGTTTGTGPGATSGTGPGATSGTDSGATTNTASDHWSQRPLARVLSVFFDAARHGQTADHRFGLDLTKSVTTILEAAHAAVDTGGWDS